MDWQYSIGDAWSHCLDSRMESEPLNWMKKQGWCFSKGIRVAEVCF